MEIGTTQSAQLRIEIRKEPSLQQRIFREIESWNQMARAERDLLGLCDEVIRIAVQDHLADHLQRHKFFRDQLRGVEKVELEACGCFFIKDLQTKLELRKITGGNCFPQIPAVEVRISAADLYGFIPHY